MKRYQYIFLLLCLLPFAGISQSPFTAGNIVVYRLGDGNTLLNAGAAKVFLDEYTPAGVLVQSIPMPSTGQKLTNFGTEYFGLPSLTVDKKRLIVPGYDVDINTLNVGPRSIAFVDCNGIITSMTIDPNPDNYRVRSVVSDAGTNLWFANGDGFGVEYTTTGSSTPLQISTTAGTTNAIAIANGDLYASTASNSVPMVKIGTGLPTSGPQTATALPGIPIRTRSQQFAFADLDANIPGVDVLYLTSQNPLAPAGIQKYSLVSGTWIANGQTGSAADAYIGLTIDVTGNSVTVYATRRGGNSDNIRGGELVKLVDNSGYNSALTGTPTVIASAGTPDTKAFRGIALVPQPVPFTPGNIAVYRAGDGVNTLNQNAAKVFIDEYTPSGELVQSIQLPASGQKVTMGGTSYYSDGMMTLSANGKFLVAPGYNAALGASPFAGNAERSIGLMDFKGVTNSVTVLPNPDFMQISSAASNDGTNLWFAGTDGIEYTTTGSSTITKLIDYSFGNMTNFVTIANGQLYIGHNGLNGSNKIGPLGNGLPTTTGQVFSELQGIGGSLNPGQFELADMDPNVPGFDVIYFASQGPSSGGIKKFSLVNNLWVANGTVGATADRYAGLSLKISANVVTIFATRQGGNSAQVRGGQLVTLTDNSGYNGTLTGTPTVLASVAIPNTKAFRGITRVPLGCPGVGVVNAINVTPSEATLSWNAITGASGYHYAVTSSANTPVAWTTTPGATVTVNGLTNGAVYYGHVRTACGASDVSEWSTVRFVAECQPPATSVLTININATGATTANWNAVFGASGYEYAITTSVTPPASGTATNGTTATIVNLNPLTSYYLHVRTSCGSGAFSAWISKSFTTGCFAPVVNITAAAKGATATWHKVNNATGYEYALTNHPGDPLSGRFTADTFRVFNDQPEGSNQYLHIRTVCGNGSFSSWYTVPFQLLGMNAYPNPADGILHLQLNGAAQFNGHVIVTNIMGSIIKKITLNGNTLDIDTRTWQTGIYMIRYIDGTHKYSVKILKK